MTEEFKQHLQGIETAVKHFQERNAKGPLYDPINYILSIGGKRIRPLVMCLVAEMYEKSIEEIIQPALGIEVFHNFTLLHDDIMDKAPLRRGNPTAHEKWGTNSAILSGDAMFIQSVQLISNCAPDKLGEVLHVFNKTALEVCEGQQMDMDFETTNAVSIDQYIEMIRLKTSVLVGGALQIAAILCGARKEDCQKLYDFGVNLGISFQLMDDILDVYGDPDKFGKQIGGDIRSNKKTYLLLKAIETADANQKCLLNELVVEGIYDEEPDRKIDTMIGLYNQLGVKELATKNMNEYYSEALANLQGLKVKESKTKPLIKLAEWLMVRNS